MNKYSSKSIFVGRLKRWLQPKHLWRIFAILALFFWNFSILSLRYNEDKITNENKIKLKSIQDAIQKYESANGEIPDSLLDLYLWCISNKNECLSKNVNPLDYQGRRVEFQRLDRKHYFLKAYSELSSIKNPKHSQIKEIHLTSNNLLFNIPDSQKNPKEYSDSPDLKNRPEIFNHMEGVSKDGQWMVKVFTDFTLGRRRLVLMSQSNNQEKSSVYLAPQLFVEEFNWITQKGDFVFSIASDPNFDSGIYLWTIQDHKIKKIWPKNTSSPANKSDLTSITSSTSSPAPENHMLSFVSSFYFENKSSCFFAKENFVKPISPSDFFSIENLYCIAYEEDPTNATVESMRAVTVLPNNFLNILTKSSPRDKTTNADLETIPFPGKEFKEWMQLPIGPELGNTLESWNTFTEKYAQSPIGPYAMWTLIRLYSDAIFEIEKNGPLSFDEEEKVQQLRTICLSLSKALAQHSLSPSYLNAFSANLHENLARNPSLSYRWAPGVFR